MNTPKIILALMLTFVGALRALSAASQLPPVEIIVVVSSYAPPEAIKADQKLVYKLLLQDVPSGSRLAMWDGYSLNCIFEADIPALRYDSAEARAEHLVDALVHLNKWSAQSSTGLPDVGLGGSNAIRLPELVTELPPADPFRPRRILVVGSPFYLSTTESSFCMTEGRYPSDANLGAAVTETVFGVAGREQALADTVIYWSYGPESQWINGAHKLAVQRWWALWTAGQKGVLAAFSSNTMVIEERLLASDTRPGWHFSRDAADSKIRMLTAVPRQAPAWLALPAPTVESTAPKPEEAPKPVMAQVKVAAQVQPTLDQIKAPLSPPPVVAIPIVPPPAPIHIAVPVRLDGTKIGIGIAWPTDVDLDLYVRPTPGGKEIYYWDDRSPEAFLYSDERHANVGGLYEFIEFRKPVDLSHTTVWVNYYGGHLVNPNGQVVLFDHGRIKVGTFTIPASHGNSGRSSHGRSISPYWVKIDLGSLIDANVPLAACRPGHK